MEWVGQPGRIEGKKKFYAGVLINGEEIVCGDCVALCPDDPSVPLYIAQVMYLWEDGDGKKRFHSKWFRYTLHITARPNNQLINRFDFNEYLNASGTHCAY